MLASFLVLGTAAIWRLLPGTGMQVRIWLGAVTGMMEMMWMPSLFAFFVGFTAPAQYLALGTAALAAGVCLLIPHSVSAVKENISEPPVLLSLCLVLPFLVLGGYLQYTHILKNVGGALYVGQSTYGDLCLHLGIATGLRGADYPAQYTLLPGTILGYPYLFDALSASMLVLGADLAPSFVIPGTIAMGMVFWGFVLLAWEMTRDCRAVVIAYLLTFLNGGLGFIYMMEGWPTDGTAFANIFTEFYATPTNMPEHNLRWVNVICDMMVPQRTILAGWMALLPAFYMLCRALKTHRRGWFIALGVWAGAMPMIHTHSFLALGLISAGCLAWEMVESIRRKSGPEGAARLRQTAANYGLYGALAVALALPQLLTWTFPQSLGGGSLAFRFNWVNNRGDGTLIDGYFWFWIKNVGLVYLLLIPAALNMPGRLKPLALGALTVYLAAECIRFQPNEYDNNKLFYAAFFLMMPFAGRLMSGIWQRMKGIRGRWLIVLPIAFACLLSGSLTIGREVVSEYQLFSAEEAQAAEYADEHAESGALFLTGSQHNNPISSLAGRKLVCGTPIYLYFHGVDYAAQQEAARLMYEEPEENRPLFEEYGVDYVYISSYERGEFDLDEETLRAMFKTWYEDDGIIILKVAG